MLWPASAVLEVLGCGDDQAVDLVGGLGAGLDRGALLRHAEHHVSACTGPYADCGTTAAWPLSAARAAASASTASVLPQRRHVGRFVTARLDHVDVGGCEMAGEAGAVRAGALNADVRDTAVRAEPVQQICVAVGVGCELSGAPPQPPRGVDRCGDMDALVRAGPRRLSRFGPATMMANASL